MEGEVARIAFLNAIHVWRKAYEQKYTHPGLRCVTQSVKLILLVAIAEIRCLRAPRRWQGPKQVCGIGMANSRQLLRLVHSQRLHVPI